MRTCLLVTVLALSAGSAAAQAPTGIPKFPLPASTIDLTGPARANFFLGDEGRRAALFGDETGGFEAWTWPIKLVRDLSFSFNIPDYDEPIDASKVARQVIVHPGYKTIVYSHPTFTVRTHIIASLNEPGALILAEGCDDAGTAPGDGCSPTCQPETGYACPGNDCAPISGDHLVVGDEACDDGNADPRDGCTADCRIAGDTCAEAVALDVIDENADPRIWTWTGSTAIFGADYTAGCTGSGGCKDAVASFTAPAAGVYGVKLEADYDAVLVALGNACDDAAALACRDAGLYAADEAVELTLGAAETVYLVADGYSHSPTNYNSGPFVLSVTARYCGDGVVSAGEQCDQGLANANTAGAACRLDCTLPRCGDGITDTSEGCDDGNLVGGDGCTRDCRVEGGCGDFIVQAAEGCDDGNTAAGDGCSPTCAPESGYACPGNVCATVCGDGILTASAEGCDDGNAVDGDGCSHCRVDGDTCQSAVSLETVDTDPSPDIWTWTATTTGATRDFNGTRAAGPYCPDTSGRRDVVAAFTVPVSGAYSFNQTFPTGTTSWDSVLFVTTTCGGNDVIGCGDTPNFTVTNLTAGTTVYIVVDGYGSTVGDSGYQGPFTLTVTRRFCGDGTVTAPEACDTGATNSDTVANACRTDCRAAHCGDGVTDTGEACDDGNTVGGDGCSARCVVEGGCGDGIVQAAEACDDGNTTANDGCSASCVVEAGWECPGNACRTICGDGVITAPETCDDANTVSWDGCTACQVDNDGCAAAKPLDLLDTDPDPNVWLWSGTTAGKRADFNSQPFCSQSGGRRDAVTAFTAPAAGTYQIVMNPASSGFDAVVFAYRGTCGGTTSAACKDGGNPETTEMTLEANETVWIVADGYSNSTGDSNSGPFTLKVTRYYCGDGTRRTGEQCDTGTANSDVTANACRTDCTLARCGDGVIDTGELCDDGNLADGDGCANDCNPEAGCGNGLVDAGEGCDDANRATGDGCSATCAVEAGWSCPSNVCAPVCGDGLTVGTEGCDDGNAIAWDGCTACRIDGDNCASAVPLALVDENPDPRAWTWQSSTLPLRHDFVASCSDSLLRDAVTAFTAPVSAIYHVEVTTAWDAVVSARQKSCEAASEMACADGPAAGTEVMDLNLLAGQTVWLLVDGYGTAADDTDVGPFLLTVAQRYCGDGVVTGTEQCDMGDENSDTSPNACRLDCTVPSCGDGVVDRGERCDDGNNLDGDACSANCLLAGLCGNGTVDAGEGCDDADLVPTDGCTSACTVVPGWDCSTGTCLPICGDGQLIGPEGCDDGNLVDGDGCSSTCQCNPAQSHTVAAVIPTPIPLNDNNVSNPVSATLTVSGVTGVITDLNVYVEVPHTYAGDVHIYLTGPTGLRIPLVRDMGSSYDNTFNGTTFDDDANPSLFAYRVTGASFSANGVKTPLQPERSLGLYNGTDPNGVWTLQVADDASGDFGSINGFSITFQTNEGIVPRAALEFSKAASEPIPNNTTTSPLLSTIVVPEGAYGDIFDVRVHANIRHPAGQDLDVYLLAPNGEVIELTTDNGGTNDNVFGGTTFLEGDLTIPLASQGTYTNNVARLETVPEASLSKLVGLPMAGTWTLKVADDASADTGGVLEGWSIEFVSVSCDLPR
jgi:cysteine-rich repeat protein